MTTRTLPGTTGVERTQDRKNPTGALRCYHMRTGFSSLPPPVRALAAPDSLLTPLVPFAQKGSGRQRKDHSSGLL